MHVQNHTVKTLEKDGLQSTQMFKRIHKKSIRTRNSSLTEATQADFSVDIFKD